VPACCFPGRDPQRLPLQADGPRRAPRPPRDFLIARRGEQRQLCGGPFPRRRVGDAQRFPLLPHALDAAARARREIGELERQLKTITDDQARLRANLKEMPSSAAAYKRYLEKFDQQETQIEEYQASIKKLQAVEHDQRKKFDDFLADFSAE
jgi:septal ring factor EnvC (AmiA/AmiB activator)